MQGSILPIILLSILVNNAAGVDTTQDMEASFSSSAPYSQYNIDSLLQEFISSTDLTSTDDFVSVFSYSGAAKLLWRAEGLVPISALDCDSASPEAISRCFIGKFNRILGVADPNGELRMVGFPRNIAGMTIVSFEQQIDGVPVFQSGLSISIDYHTDMIVSVSSSFVAGTSHIEFTSGIDAVDIDGLSLASGIDIRTIHHMTPTYFVDRSIHSTIAIPAFLVATTTSDGLSYLMVVDSDSLVPLDLTPLDGELSDVLLGSNTFAKEHSTHTCGSGQLCPLNFTPSVCFMNNCIKLCSIPSDCSIYGEDWDCTTTTGYSNHCASVPIIEYGRLVASPLLVYSSSSGWVDVKFSYYTTFAQVKTILDRYNSWLWNDFGFSSYNDDSEYPAPLSLSIYLDYDGLTTASAEWLYGSKEVHLYNASLFPLSTDQLWAGEQDVFGHEFGHAIQSEKQFTGNPGFDCGSEIIADMLGTLFTVSYYSGNWPLSCSPSAYDDDVCGMNSSPNDGYSPYARRFAYDYYPCVNIQGFPNWTGIDCPTGTECGPYEVCMKNSLNENECNTYASYNNNMAVWRRFLRIWAEGSATFSENGLGESMGTTFSGAGLDNVTTIFSDVTKYHPSLGSLFTLQDLAFLLISSSGQFSAATRYALGAIGLRTGEYSVAGGYYTDRSISGERFDSWTLSASDKNFYAWKEYGSGKIRVRYHNGSEYVVAEWTTANAGTSPAIAVYNGRIYVFWADATSGAITYRYYTSSGSISSYISLGSKGIVADGDFDVAVYRGSLVIVFKRPNDYYAYVSRCTATSNACILSSWETLDGDYRLQIPIQVRPGMGAIALENLNGLYFWDTDSEYLYIAYAFPYGENLGRIGIARVYIEGSSATLMGTMRIHESSPSYRTMSRIGVTARISAYPDENNYLYLAWKDKESTQIYSSIVQSWDGFVENSILWTTRPHFLELLSSDGPTYHKSEGYLNATDVNLLYRDGTTIRRSAYFGRY